MEKVSMQQLNKLKILNHKLKQTWLQFNINQRTHFSSGLGVDLKSILSGFLGGKVASSTIEQPKLITNDDKPLGDIDETFKKLKKELKNLDEDSDK